jgi:hypothetical protein
VKKEGLVVVVRESWLVVLYAVFLVVLMVGALLVSFRFVDG